MATLKETAEAYRLGVAYGIVDSGRAVAWADRVIAASDTPDASIIAASSAWAQGAEPLLSALRAVPGQADPSTVLRLLLALVDETLTRVPAAADDVASALYWMQVDDVARALDRMQVDDGIKGCDLGDELEHFDDWIYLAHDGVCSLDEARAAVVRFVRTHRAAVID